MKTVTETVGKGRAAGSTRSPRAMRGWLIVACTLLFVVPAIAEKPRARRGRIPRRARKVTVMTRNLYLGADVARVIDEPDPYAVPVRVAETYGMILHNEFPARAIGLAAEVAEAKPELVGLQEVTLLRMQTPSDLIPPAPQPRPAGTVIMDYLEILMSALERHGCSYSVVNVVTNFDVELPMPVVEGGEVSYVDVRMTDRTAILARNDLPSGCLRVRNAQAGNFETELVIPSAMGPLPVSRGWCSVDAQVRGRSFRFIVTHPEAFHEGVRVAQIEELIAGPAAACLPVVLVADGNSDAASHGMDGYNQLIEAGFRDAWIEVGHSTDSGLTFGHEEDLWVASTALTKRLDLVLCRGPFGVQAVDVIGEEESDRTPSLIYEGVELWPSDHAGVLGVLRIR